MNDIEIRERAKALGIRNWHNRKIDKLREMVAAQDETAMKNSEVIISFDSLFAASSEAVRAEVVRYLDSIEVLSKGADFCSWLEEKVTSGKFVSNTDLKVIWEHWLVVCPHEKYDSFLSLVKSFSLLLRNSGWHIDGGKLKWDVVPALLPSWHAKRWLELSGNIERERARAVFSLLFDGE